MSADKEAKLVRLSLRAKWTAALFAFGVLPLAAFGYFALRAQRANLAVAEKDLQIATIEHVTAAVLRPLDDAAEATHRVGRLLTEAHISSVDARLELAGEAMARAKMLVHVEVYAPDGQFKDAITRKGVEGGPPPAAKLAPAVVANAAEQGVWLAPEFSPAGVTLRYAERMAGGDLRGWVVVGTIAPGTLAEEVAGISQNRFNRPDRVLLVDEALHVLAGAAPGELDSEHSLKGRGIFRGIDVPPGAFRVQFGLTTEFRSESGEAMVWTFQRALQELGAALGVAPKPGAMVGTVQSVRQQGWAVVVQRPEDEAFGALAASRDASLIAAAVVALVAIALGALLAARTTRPVKALVELTRAYGRREFAARSPVRSGDELELLGASMSEMAEKLEAGEAEIARRAAVEASLSRYVPAEVARSIAEGRQILRHGGERRVISVVFADVVGFTAMSEHLPPEKVVALLNELFTVMTEVVFRHGGTVDKFMGDSVMALFGALNPQPDHAVRALSTAEDMHRFVEASAPAWKTTYGMDVRLGIGVNTGEALVGNLGSDLRMEYTAIGDVINVASRLEALARPGQTLVTADVAEAVKGVFSMADLGEHPLRGKRQTVRIYELK